MKVTQSISIEYFMRFSTAQDEPDMKIPTPSLTSTLSSLSTLKSAISSTVNPVSFGEEGEERIQNAVVIAVSTSIVTVLTVAVLVVIGVCICWGMNRRIMYVI